VHNDIGFNYRLSNLHAAIGLAQTEKADELRQLRRRNHSMYVERLSGVPGIRFQKDDDPDYLHVHWMNAILVDEAEYGMDRDSLMEHLRRNGIDSRKLFTGMHRQKALLDYGCEADGYYPVSERLAAEGLYLPSSSHLSVGQIERVCDVILKGSAL
jgi:perosamine synthetase